jgi:CubicO group peptidase (beta-lactamase class C family)
MRRRSLDFMLSRREFGGALLLGSLAAHGANPHATSEALDGLPRDRPDRQGVDAAAVGRFLDDVSAAGIELHSVMLARHGHVVAEGWWWPYAAARPHMMHSLTKSVTACGVGLAIEEGRFSLDDRVVGFFDRERPAVVSDHLALMTVRDLLSMQTGHASEVSGAVWRPIKTSWVAEFFKVPVVHRPGTTFVYTSAASFMLSAIISKTTGQRLRDYLEPRLFAPLGIRGLQWDLGPGDINPGGNGLSWTTSDVLKLGLLHAQRGRWRERQVLPESWVREATSAQVPHGGYGYHWWIGPGAAAYAFGLFAQHSIVFPRQDAVLAITAAVSDYRDLLKRVWKHFPAAFEGPSDGPAVSAVAARLAALRLLSPPAPSSSPVAAQVTGRTFRVDPNEDGVEHVAFEFTADRCRFRLRDARGEHTIVAGTSDWIEGDTSMTGNRLHHQYQPESMRVVAGGRWVDPRTFEMTWQFAETAFRDRVVCRFHGADRVMVDRSVNVNSAETSRPTLHGRAT